MMTTYGYELRPGTDRLTTDSTVTVTPATTLPSPSNDTVTSRVAMPTTNQQSSMTFVMSTAAMTTASTDLDTDTDLHSVAVDETTSAASGPQVELSTQSVDSETTQQRSSTAGDISAFTMTPSSGRSEATDDLATSRHTQQLSTPTRQFNISHEHQPSTSPSIDLVTSLVAMTTDSVQSELQSTTQFHTNEREPASRPTSASVGDVTTDSSASSQQLFPTSGGHLLTSSASSQVTMVTSGVTIGWSVTSSPQVQLSTGTDSHTDTDIEVTEVSSFDMVTAVMTSPVVMTNTSVPASQHITSSSNGSDSIGSSSTFPGNELVTPHVSMTTVDSAQTEQQSTTQSYTSERASSITVADMATDTTQNSSASSQQQTPIAALTNQQSSVTVVMTAAALTTPSTSDTSANLDTEAVTGVQTVSVDEMTSAASSPQVELTIQLTDSSGHMSTSPNNPVTMTTSTESSLLETPSGSSTLESIASSTESIPWSVSVSRDSVMTSSDVTWTVTTAAVTEKLITKSSSQGKISGSTMGSVADTTTTKRRSSNTISSSSVTSSVSDGETNGTELSTATTTDDDRLLLTTTTLDHRLTTSVEPGVTSAHVAMTTRRRSTTTTTPTISTSHSSSRNSTASASSARTTTTTITHWANSTTASTVVIATTRKPVTSSVAMDTSTSSTTLGPGT